MFIRLQEYKEKHGDCLVPKRFKEDSKLGTWVDTQRVQYKKMKKKLASQGVEYEGPTDTQEDDEGTEECEEGTGASGKPVVGRLTNDRIRRLENLGFMWSLRDDWQKHYEELKEYKKQYGHCNVPARYAKNRRLGIWVSAQRQQYKIMQTPAELRPKRSASLTQDRINMLNKLTFTWTIRSRDSFGESWNQRLQDLREYKAIHGNCLVPSRYPPNPELGIWVGTQRTQYRLYMKSKDTGQPIPGSAGMDDSRVLQLEELGFIWALRGEQGKKEADDPIEVDAVEAEARQVAAVLPSGVPHEGIVGEVVHVGLGTSLPEIEIEHAEI
jgi:Helicase associated domain